MKCLDLDRLHQVALGEWKGRAAGNTTLFLVDIVHAVWSGERHLVSVPISYDLHNGGARWGRSLLTELEEICRHLRVDYRRINALAALVEGVSVRVHLHDRSGTQLRGLGNCSEVREIFFSDKEQMPPYYPDANLFLCPITLATNFFKEAPITLAHTRSSLRWIF